MLKGLLAGQTQGYLRVKNELERAKGEGWADGEHHYLDTEIWAAVEVTHTAPLPMPIASTHLQLRQIENSVSPLG